MGVRAKFKLDSYETYEMVVHPTKEDGTKDWSKSELREVRSLKFSAVSADGPENGQFFAFTPSGHVDLATVNPAAWEQFKLGEEYYLDFTPAK